MKQTINLILVMVISLTANCQQWVGASTSSSILKRDGEISVLDNSMSKISLGSAYNGVLFGTGYLGFNLQRNANGLWAYKTDGASSGASLIYSDVTGSIHFSVRNGWFLPTAGTLNDNDVLNNNVMTIQQSGKVVIGNNSITSFPNGYRLFVQDGILTESVKVALKNTNDWSDFVFKKDYKLMPLKQVEKYIQANQHLPEVPSAQEVVNGGLDLAKMDAKLLQKIEELTLYTIELNKQLEAMKEKLSLLETQK